MTKDISILGLDLCFVLRHKWDENTKYGNIFRTYGLGISFEKNQYLSARSLKEKKCIFKNKATIKLDLIVITMWVNIIKKQ